MSEQERAEAEDFASRHYEDLPHHKDAAKRGFLAGRTVTAEQVQAVAVVLAEMNGEPRPGRFERTITRAAFQAAGLLIEGVDQ